MSVVMSAAMPRLHSTAANHSRDQRTTAGKRWWLARDHPPPAASSFTVFFRSRTISCFTCWRSARTRPSCHRCSRQLKGTRSGSTGPLQSFPHSRKHVGVPHQRVTSHQI